VNIQAAELAELSTPYQGKGLGEQEYELALALVRIGEENQTPDLGVKDFWLRARSDLVGKVVELRVVVDATAVAAADQVLREATSSGLDAMVYQIPLAILTAMIIDSVISAIDKGDDHDKGSTGG
jgi:hypothetical protein